MEINNSTSSMNNDHTNNTHSFGTQLKQARLDKDLSLEHVSAELYILKRHLQALEEENFEQLPQAAFTRGFAVNYAKYLGLDPQRIIDGFDSAYPEHLKKKSVTDIESPLRPMGTLQREGGRSWRINPLLIIGVILLIALGVFLMRIVGDAQDRNAMSENSVTDVEGLSNSDQAAGAYVDPSINNSPNSATGGSAVNVDNQATSPSVTGQMAANGNTAQSSLDFWVQGDTNITVVDATGTSLLNGVQSRGAYELVGVPPFQIQIDNVSRVSLDFDKEKVLLSEYAEDNKASFVLSAKDNDTNP